MYGNKFPTFNNFSIDIIRGSFKPLATGFSNTDNLGHGFTVTRNGTGDYTINLLDEYVSLVYWDINLRLHAAADAMAEIGDVSLSGKSVTVRIVKKSDGVTAVDPTGDANTRVSFELELKTI